MARKNDPEAGAVQQIPVREAGLPGLLADCVEDPLAVLDRDGRVRFVSRSFRTLLGSPDAAERARDLVEHVDPEERDRVLAALGDDASRVRFRVRTDDGRWRRLELRTRNTSTGSLARLSEVAPHFLEPSPPGERDALQLVATHLEDALWVVDLARSRLHYVSPGFESLWERSRRELADGAGAFFDTIHAEDRERIRKLAYESLEAGFEEEFRIELPDGRTRWVRHRSLPVRNEAGVVVLTVGITQDIDRRMEAEARLRESEERYRQLVEDSPESIVVYADGKIVYANPAGAELAGMERPDDLIGRPVTDFIDPASHEFVETHLRRVSRGETRSGPGEHRLRRRDGEVRDVMGSGSRVTYDGRPAVQAVARDITDWKRGERERERLQLQLQEARKLESLGFLAGGIAHDFNNLLAVILSNTRFSLGQVEPEDAHEALTDALEAGESASRLTQQLLAYAGRRAPEVCALCLSAHVRSVSDLLETAVPKHVTLQLDLAADLQRVRADVVQIEQVLMNLLLNAVDAIGDTPGGVVTIATGREKIAAAGDRRWVGVESVEPGDYAYLEVVDTGRGMDESVRERIFDTFFTTKVVGHGLGLSGVVGLVRGHAGAIEIDSRRGGGTRIRVYLSAADEPDDA
jgi:PAS domain S-box-containing protein